MLARFSGKPILVYGKESSMITGPGFAELDLNAHAFSYVGRKVCYRYQKIRKGVAPYYPTAAPAAVPHGVGGEHRCGVRGVDIWWIYSFLREESTCPGKRKVRIPRAVGCPSECCSFDFLNPPNGFYYLCRFGVFCICSLYRPCCCSCSTDAHPGSLHNTGQVETCIIQDWLPSGRQDGRRAARAHVRVRYFLR